MLLKWIIIIIIIIISIIIIKLKFDRVPKNIACRYFNKQICNIEVREGCSWVGKVDLLRIHIYRTPDLIV